LGAERRNEELVFYSAKGEPAANQFLLLFQPATPGCAFKNRDPVQNPQTEEFWGRLQGKLYGMSAWGYNGMTTNSYCEKVRFRHSDKAPGRNLDATASLPNQERRTWARSVGTKN